MDSTWDPSIVEYVIEDSSDEVENSTQLDLTVGIMEEAFVVLNKKADSNRQNQKPTLCGLLIGEIKLAQKYERHKGKLFGYTEGMGRSPLHEPKKMASKAVIFMVISMTENWKIPVGLFFVHNPDIKYFADTIEETLKKLNENGIEIISITLNCLSPHLSFALAEELGAEIDSLKPTGSFKAYFAHPSSGKAVHILYDLDIILGFLKSYWATERVMRYKTKKLDYSMCIDVKKIEEIDLQTYSPDAMFDWIIIKKRVGIYPLSYDTDNFGKTIANAMQYLKDLGHPDFRDSGPTIQFVRVLDLMAEISKITGQPEQLYHNLSESNEQDWKPLILKIIPYVKELRSLNQDTPEHLSVFKTYIMGIMVYFTSLLEIYSNHVKIYSENDTYVLPSLLPSRFGLKHIRLGLFENSSNDKDMTALGMFTKMKSFTGNLHFIDTHLPTESIYLTKHENKE